LLGTWQNCVHTVFEINEEASAIVVFDRTADQVANPREILTVNRVALVAVSNSAHIVANFLKGLMLFNLHFYAKLCHGFSYEIRPPDGYY